MVFHARLSYSPYRHFLAGQTCFSLGFAGGGVLTVCSGYDTGACRSGAGCGNGRVDSGDYDIEDIQEYRSPTELPGPKPARIFEVQQEWVQLLRDAGVDTSVQETNLATQLASALVADCGMSQMDADAAVQTFLANPGAIKNVSADACNNPAAFVASLQALVDSIRTALETAETNNDSLSVYTNHAPVTTTLTVSALCDGDHSWKV